MTTPRLDIDIAKKTIDFIFQSPSNYLTIEFQGGETLLNFEIIKYCVEYAQKLNSLQNRNLEFAIVTNLNNLTDNILDFFKLNKMILCIRTEA